ncbi:MAG: pentapeptide repeat-containing protein [Chloroflexi bacterium]|nr:pentapeptide repeat-containing protein [Chloroflexota bacterium]
MKKRMLIFWRSVLLWWNLQRVAVGLLILAVFIAAYGYINQHGSWQLPLPFVADFYANVSTELISIVITILIIDGLNERRTIQQEKQALILQMSSPTNFIAKEAARILRMRGWLTDGTLQGANLLRANLRKVLLVKADLRGALFYKAELWDAYLHETNLTGAIELEDWQLVTVKYLRKAILPDGKVYDGRFNLRGDLSWAYDKLGIAKDDDQAIADFYGVPVDDYRRGQIWAAENLQKLRQVAAARDKKASKIDMDIDR